MQTLSPLGDYEFIMPAPELRRYFSSYYFFEISTPGRVELEDLLYPEWASARFMLEGMIPASLVPDPVAEVPRASLTGPTSRACHISCAHARMAGIGILPLGWARFIGASAHAPGCGASRSKSPHNGHAASAALTTRTQRFLHHRNMVGHGSAAFPRSP